MPEHVAEAEEPRAVVARQYLLVAIDVGNVVDLHAQTPVGLLDVAGRQLERPEIAGECQLLLVVEALVAKDQDGEAIHPRLDRGYRLAIDAPAQIDAAYLADESGVRRVGGLDGQRHFVSLPRTRPSRRGLSEGR